MATAGCLGLTDPETELPDLQDQSDPDLDWTVDDINMGGEFVGTIGANINAFDPINVSDTTSAKTTNLIYEGLTVVDFENEIHPCLATDWEQIDDTTFEFSLEQGVQFHDDYGEMTAEDVQVSIERYEDSPRHGDVFDWYESSEVIDDYTIRIELWRPYAPFLSDMAGISIVPAEAGMDDEDGDIDLTNNPLGTGPYEFVEYRPDDLFRAERFDDYWWEGDDLTPDVAPIETVTLHVIEEQGAQLAALQGGDVDMINSIDPEDVGMIQQNEDFTITQTFSSGFDMLIYPLQLEPYSNEKVRRGITRLIPREEIVQNVVFHGHAQEAAHPISPSLGETYFDADFHERMNEEYVGEDHDRGVELVEEGFEELGIDAPYETEIISNENPVRIAWAEVIQHTLNETGLFDVSLEEVEWATYVDMVLGEGSEERDQLVALGWSGGADPDYQVNLLFNSEYNTPGCCNVNHYHSQEIEQLISDGVETFDDEERAEIYEDMSEILCRESPMSFLWYGFAMDAIRDDTIVNWRTYYNDSGETTAIYTPQIGQVAWLNE